MLIYNNWHFNNIEHKVEFLKEVSYSMFLRTQHGVRSEIRNHAHIRGAERESGLPQIRFIKRETELDSNFDTF